MGCRLTLIKDEEAKDGYRVEGNMCARGRAYAIKELCAPTRVITSTVKIKNAILKRLPVKTDGDIPKELNFKCMEEINKVELEAPVKIGQVVVEDVLGTGINIVASRSMDRIE